MIFVRLVVLTLFASICEVSQGACSRRARAGSVARVVPAATCLPASPCPGRRYERTLEDIISKLINAFIYTTIRNVGGGAGGSGSGGSGSGGSGEPLLDIDVDLAGQDLADVELLPRFIGGSSGSGGSGSGGGSTGSSGTGASCDCDTGSGGSGTTSGGSGTCSDRSISDVVKLLESLLNLDVQLTEDNNVIKICLLGGNES